MNLELLKKFLTFSYGSWVGLLVGLLTTMVTTRIFSPEVFGVLSIFALSINVLAIIIIFGSDQSFARFFYEEKEEKRGGLLYNSLNLPLVLSILTIFIIIFFKNPISLFLFGEESNMGIALFIIGILSQVIYRFAHIVIRMQQKANKYSILEIVNKLLNLIFLIIFFFLLGDNYEIIIISTVLTMFILAIIAISTESKYWHIRNLKLTNLKHSKKEILLYGSPLVLTILITWLFQAMDKIALRNWSTFEELGLYTAAFKIIALLNILQTTFSSFWTPISLESFEKKPNDRKIFSDMFSTVSLVMFFIAIMTIIFKDLIALLLGEEYREAANLMPFLVFIPLMYTISETTAVGISFYKKPKWHIYIALISCVVNFLGNWILVPFYGALGASISTAISFIVFFTLRTHVSLIYFKVGYKLRKVYLMSFIIIFYALFEVTKPELYLRIIAGIIVLIILLICYKDTFINFRNLKNFKIKNN